MKTGYLIEIFIPATPEDPASIERAAEFHMLLDNMHQVTLPDDAEVSRLKWIRRKVPAPSSTPETTQEEVGGVAQPNTAAPSTSLLPNANEELLLANDKRTPR